MNQMSSSRVASPSKENSSEETKLVLIPAGWFRMGSKVGQENERPVHQVWIDAFYLAACQVTHSGVRLALSARADAKRLHAGMTRISMTPKNQ